MKNRFADWHDEIAAWRRDLHAHPELQYETHRTAGIVAGKLREFGCDEVVEGIGRTGVVGLIHGRGGGARVVGLRADMDALPIEEATGAPWASTVPGAMHACGHDGHTAMLLGAARYLAETRNFAGTVAVIFQPAEEGGAGGQAMVDDGLMERFAIAEVYGLHNWPGRPEGSFAIRSGPFFASTDQVDITVEGRGGHAARPQDSVDPAVVAAQIILAAQTIVSRSTDPVDQLVVSITSVRTASDAYNVIAPRAELKGTIRALDEDVRQMARERLRMLAEHTARAHGAEAAVTLTPGYPVMVNAEAGTAHAAAAATQVAGDCAEAPLVLGAEDFAFMLNARPGAYILLGNGETAMVHQPGYDFNDAVIPAGCAWWAALAEARLPLAG